MQTYQIDQRVSGVTLGQWQANSENDALNLMAQDQGCKDYDTLLSTTGETRKTHTLAISIIDPLESIRVAFDNAGGVTLWSDLNMYAHSYNEGKQPAEDVKVVLDGGDIANWDGNEKDLYQALQDEDEVEKYERVYTLAEIADLLKGDKIQIEDGDMFIPSTRRSQNGLVSGYSESEFFRTLSLGKQ